MLDRILLGVEVAAVIGVVLVVAWFALQTLIDVRAEALEEDEARRAELVRRASARGRR